MNFKLLLSVLRLYESNMRNLHWNSRGEEFNDAHKSITEEYYELLSETIDKVAEIMSMFDIYPPNYSESLSIINSSNRDFLIVKSDILYDRSSIISEVHIMLRDINDLFAMVLSDEKFEDPLNAGIKSELEDILYKFTFEYRYINKRRLQN